MSTRTSSKARSTGAIKGVHDADDAAHRKQSRDDEGFAAILSWWIGGLSQSVLST
jgi:hypothetical protein